MPEKLARAGRIRQGRPSVSLALPLLELRDQLLDLGLESLERREHLRLQVPLQLLALIEEILQQVADPLAQRAPGGRGLGLGRLRALGRQGIHGVSPLKRSWMIRTPSGSGFTRGETVTPPLFTTRLGVGMGVRVAEGPGLENRYARKGIVGSNPTPSAVIKTPRRRGVEWTPRG